MKVESIAECCNTFDLHFDHFVVFLSVAALDRFYCIRTLFDTMILKYFCERIIVENINFQSMMFSSNNNLVLHINYSHIKLLIVYPY